MVSQTIMNKLSRLAVVLNFFTQQNIWQKKNVDWESGVEAKHVSTEIRTDIIGLHY